MRTVSPKTTFHERSRGRLLRRRADLGERIARELRATGRPEYEALAGQVHDRGDESQVDLLVDVFYAGLEHDLAEARDQDEAIARLERGGYGFCVDCSLPIPESRLEAYPTAKRCRSCQEKHERQERASTSSL